MKFEILMVLNISMYNILIFYKKMLHEIFPSILIFCSLRRFLLQNIFIFNYKNNDLVLRLYSIHDKCHCIMLHLDAILFNV